MRKRVIDSGHPPKCVPYIIILNYLTISIHGTKVWNYNLYTTIYNNSCVPTYVYIPWRITTSLHVAFNDTLSSDWSRKNNRSKVRILQPILSFLSFTLHFSQVMHGNLLVRSICYIDLLLGNLLPSTASNTLPKKSMKIIFQIAFSSFV